ncbi:MAG: GFA family protein [Pseudomonadota bacterium]
MRVLHGSCHCKAVKFEVSAPNGLVDVSHCDCSLCRRKTAYVATTLLANLKVTKGADKLSLYQFNTNTAKHYFCSICGIYTHHQRRSNPNEFGFNIGCIEGVNPFDHAPAPVHDGVNHPRDREPD